MIVIVILLLLAGRFTKEVNRRGEEE